MPTVHKYKTNSVIIIFLKRQPKFVTQLVHKAEKMYTIKQVVKKHFVMAILAVTDTVLLNNTEAVHNSAPALYYIMPSFVQQLSSL